MASGSILPSASDASVRAKLPLNRFLAALESQYYPVCAEVLQRKGTQGRPRSKPDASGVSSFARFHEPFWHHRSVGSSRERLLPCRRFNRRHKQLRERPVSGFQSDGAGSVRGRLQAMRPWHHDHLQYVVHIKGRSLKHSATHCSRSGARYLSISVRYR